MTAATARVARVGRSSLGMAARAAGAAAVLLVLGCGGDGGDRAGGGNAPPGSGQAPEVATRSEPSDRDRDTQRAAEADRAARTEARDRQRSAEADPAARTDHRAQDQRTADVAHPRRIEIPAIGVSAPVIALGLNDDRTLEVPEDYGDTGWWRGGPEPGERGAAVIAGHVDSRTGPAVFHKLDELASGDEIRVHRADGTRARFVVRRLERHPKDEFPTNEVYGSTDGPTLRLITCSGDFDAATGHYVDNTIVFADAAPTSER